MSQAPDVVKLAMVGLVGGKGGFGAALRAMAKQAGDKKTTDFGACRDLQVDTPFRDSEVWTSSFLFTMKRCYSIVAHMCILIEF